MPQPPLTAVVTGASTGIGYATANFLAAKKGWRVFAGVRKQADANRLSDEIGDNVTPLIMEVTSSDSLNAAAARVREALGGRTLNGLVNNAGIAVSGPLLELPIDEFEKQLAVNVTGVVRATQAFGPLLGADRALEGPPGRIVMISSVAGEMGAPFLGPYAASKHAVEGLSKSLRRELNLYGIEVVVIGPGAVATPIWDKADEVDTSGYKDSDFYEGMVKVQKWMMKNGPNGFPPERIAKRVWTSLTEDKPKFRYAEVPDRFTNWTLPKLLPDRLVDKMVTKRLGLSRRFRTEED